MVNTGNILSLTRRAVEDYNMIEESDKIVVGVSAGKDSLTLLCAMAQLRIFYPKKFDLLAVTLDCGFEGADYAGIKDLCKELEVEYMIEKTNIREVVFDIRNEKNPCALCSNLRHGTLNETVKRLGYNKVALGHHMDDSVETFIMNLMYEGRIGSFAPVVYLDRSDLTLIRPLIYVPERDIKNFAARERLPIVHNSCPANGKTKREAAKDILDYMCGENKSVRNYIFSAMQRSGIDGYKERKSGRRTKKNEES